MKFQKLFSAAGALTVASAVAFTGSASAFAAETLPEKGSLPVAVNTTNEKPVQHVEAPDKSRSVDAVKFEQSSAVYTVHTLPGDQLLLSENRKIITWISSSGETVATLDATNTGRTPLNRFHVFGNTIKLHFYTDRSACMKSYVANVTFQLAWHGAVCGALTVVAAPAGLACVAGTIAVSPLIPWDHVC